MYGLLMVPLNMDANSWICGNTHYCRDEKQILQYVQLCVYNEGKFVHVLPKHCFVDTIKNNPVKVFFFSLSPSASCFIHSPTVAVLWPSSFLANL